MFIMRWQKCFKVETVECNFGLTLRLRWIRTLLCQAEILISTSSHIVHLLWFSVAYPRLKGSKIVRKKHVTVWSKLRNKSLHAITTWKKVYSLIQSQFQGISGPFQQIVGLVAGQSLGTLPIDGCNRVAFPDSPLGRFTARIYLQITHTEQIVIVAG